MAKTLNKLKPATVKDAKPRTRDDGKVVARKLGDGGGLWLVCTEKQKSWVFIYIRGGKRREMGLGAYPTITLAAARDAAEEARGQLAKGEDPLEARRQGKPSNGATFGDAADAYIEAHCAEWKGGAEGKQCREWMRTLSRLRDDAGKLIEEGYALPIIGKAVADLSVEDIKACIGPEWTTKQVTMSRTRARIEAVIDAAIAAGHRTAPNPAAWKAVKPLVAKINYEVEHHAALDWRKLPAFMARLRATPGIPARALEWTILTVARAQETGLATWAEIDRAARCWRVPPHHMKRNRPHEVPLCDRALAILAEMEALRPENDGALIFPSEASTPLSNATISDVHRAIAQGVTTHGFRSTFSDWANDATDYHADVIEHALAHKVKGVRGSYRRATAYDKRALLMAAWESHCMGKAASEAERPAYKPLHRVRRLAIRRPALILDAA